MRALLVKRKKNYIMDMNSSRSMNLNEILKESSLQRWKASPEYYTPEAQTSGFTPEYYTPEAQTSGFTPEYYTPEAQTSGFTPEYYTPEAQTSGFTPEYYTPEAQTSGFTPEYYTPEAQTSGFTPEYYTPEAQTSGFTPEYYTPEAQTSGFTPEYYTPEAESEEEEFVGSVNEALVVNEARNNFINGLVSEYPPNLQRLTQEFAPALLPVLRIGIRLIGRQRVVGFLAKLVAKLLKPLIGQNFANPLSRVIADAGLRLLSLENPRELPNQNRLVAETIANIVTESVERIGSAARIHFGRRRPSIGGSCSGVYSRIYQRQCSRPSVT